MYGIEVVIFHQPADREELDGAVLVVRAVVVVLVEVPADVEEPEQVEQVERDAVERNAEEGEGDRAVGIHEDGQDGGARVVVAVAVGARAGAGGHGGGVAAEGRGVYVDRDGRGGGAWS